MTGVHDAREGLAGQDEVREGFVVLQQGVEPRLVLAYELPFEDERLEGDGVTMHPRRRRGPRVPESSRGRGCLRSRIDPVRQACRLPDVQHPAVARLEQVISSEARRAGHAPARSTAMAHLASRVPRSSVLPREANRHDGAVRRPAAAQQQTRPRCQVERCTSPNAPATVGQQGWRLQKDGVRRARRQPGWGPPPPSARRASSARRGPAGRRALRRCCARHDQPFAQRLCAERNAPAQVRQQRRVQHRVASRSATSSAASLHRPAKHQHGATKGEPSRRPPWLRCSSGKDPGGRHRATGRPHR